MTAARVTAIVVTYHTGARLKECLYALKADPEIAEIVLVDNGNPPDTRRWITTFIADCDKAELVRPDTNLGFGQGVNAGAERATGTHLLMINPDAVLRRGSATQMLDAAEGLREPWIVGGRIYDTAGREQRGCRRRELTLWRAITGVIGWNTWTLENTPPPDGPIAMPVISGALFMTSAKGFAELGGFDARYFLHVEDVDLCRRCRAMGGEVVYTPHAGALHYGATSRVSSQTVAQYKADSFKAYLRIWASGPIERALVTILIPVMSLAARLRAG